MEKIKVNMTPIEEVKTIHASQNDNATRKWAFDLYDENGKIDSSDIKEQMIFDSRVGGTEQILPENTSDPTTSPIIADIQYPDSLRSEQTFLYRESPTTEDGQSKITHIKGNTLVWNQLILSPTFTNSIADTRTVLYFRIATMSPFVAYYTEAISTPKKVSVIFTKTQSGELRIFHNGQSSNIYFYSFADSLLPLNHKYLFSADLTSVDPTTVGGISGKNAILFDLTQMGLDYITSVDQFTSLYPLPYYDYTIGKLLPFLGTELKTTGKNQLPLPVAETKDGVTLVHNTDGSVTLSGTATRTTYFDFFPNGNFDTSFYEGYVFSFGDVTFSAQGVRVRVSNESRSPVQEISNGSVLNDNGNGLYIAIRVANGYVIPNNFTIYPMMRKADTSDTFEPYTSSTINLPTLTYFPTGMKSAGSVYDEITESKAIARVGRINMGDVVWRQHPNDTTVYYATSSAWNIPARTLNLLCALYITSNAYGAQAGMPDKSITADNSANNYLYLKDSSFVSNPSGLKTYLNGVYLYYPLATPTEEEIITASLVTEKGEAPLYYDDELIADCNETISSESGIFDAKIKLMTDETIYSQKIQLHVERKPQ